MNSNEWVEYSLGEICSFTSGTAFPRESQNSANGTIPFIKVSDLNTNGNERWIDYANNHISESEAKKLRAKIHPPLATTFAKIGIALTFNRRRLLRKKTIVDNNMASAVPNKSVIDPIFFYYLLLTVDFNKISSGTALPYLNFSDLEQIPVHVPPLTVQWRIAEILSALDDKIELNRQTNATLEAIAQAIFKEWFVDFNYPGATGEMVESELGPIPQGWQVGTLADILVLNNEIISPGSFPDKLFFHYSIPAFDSGRVPSQEFGTQILSNKFKVKQDSILVSKLNPRIPRIWAIKKVDEASSICSTEFQVLMPSTPNYYSYAVNLLYQSSISETMRSRASGTSSSHQRISPKDLMDIMIIIPSDDLLTLFDRIVGIYFHYIGNSLDEMINLSKIRDLLLPYLLASQNSLGNES